MAKGKVKKRNAVTQLILAAIGNEFVLYSELNAAMVQDGLLETTKDGKVPGGLAGLWALKKNETWKKVGLPSNYEIFVSSGRKKGQARHAEALNAYNMKAKKAKKKPVTQKNSKSGLMDALQALADAKLTKTEKKLFAKMIGS